MRMNRRKFLLAASAALAGAAARFSGVQTQSLSTGPTKVYLPTIINKAVLTSNPAFFSLPYTWDFLNMAAGALPLTLSGPTWTVKSGAASNAPRLGTQLTPYGGMDSGTTTGFSALGATLSVVTPGRTGAAGDQSLGVTLSGASGYLQTSSAIAATQGDWLHSEVWIKNNSLSAGLFPIIQKGDGSAALSVYSFNTGVSDGNGGTIWESNYTGSSWVQRVLTAQAVGPSGIIQQVSLNGSVAGQAGGVDDFYCYKLDPKDLFATLKVGANYAVCVHSRDDVKMRQYGLVLNCDSPSSPKNFLLVWYDRLNGVVVVDQYLNGVMSNLAHLTESDNFAFLGLTAVKSGASLDVYWGNQKITASPLAVNAALTNNPYAGFMSPYGGGIVGFTAALAPVRTRVLCYGDSKFARNLPGIVKNLTNGSFIATESPSRFASDGTTEVWAVSGETTFGAAMKIDQNITDYGNSGTPDLILYNLGANDFAEIAKGGWTKQQWQDDTRHIMLAMHNKWPNAKLYAAHAWTISAYWSWVTPDILATWLDEVLADPAMQRWAFHGPDERVFLQNGDNGTSLTKDGVHPNDLGSYVTAQQWRRVVGFG